MHQPLAGQPVTSSTSPAPHGERHQLDARRPLHKVQDNRQRGDGLTLRIEESKNNKINRGLGLLYSYLHAGVPYPPIRSRIRVTERVAEGIGEED
jgi:hypothetical protein